jgi:hypothetical protein
LAVARPPTIRVAISRNFALEANQIKYVAQTSTAGVVPRRQRNPRRNERRAGVESICVKLRDEGSMVKRRSTTESAVSDYSKIKQTPEYREARREVQTMIDREVGLVQQHVGEIGNAVRAAEQKLKALESQTEMLSEHPKAFTMIFAAIFTALDPAAIQKITDNLRISLNASIQQNAHPAVLAELGKVMTILNALSARK